MVSKPRKVIIDLDNKTVIVKTVMRAYQDEVDVTENLNVKAADMRVASFKKGGVETIPAISLTLVIDGERIQQHLPEKGVKAGISPEYFRSKDSASQGHGWPGEDQGRDYGGLTKAINDDNVKKRKNVPYY